MQLLYITYWPSFGPARNQLNRFPPTPKAQTGKLNAQPFPLAPFWYFPQSPMHTRLFQGWSCILALSFGVDLPSAAFFKYPSSFPSALYASLKFMVLPSTCSLRKAVSVGGVLRGQISGSSATPGLLKWLRLIVTMAENQNISSYVQLHLYVNKCRTNTILYGNRMESDRVGNIYFTRGDPGKPL